MDPNDHFVALQNSVLARLTEVDPEVPAPTSATAAVVPYISELKHDIVVELTTKLNKIGIGVVVKTPLAKMIEQESMTLSMEAPIMIEISENVIANRGPNGTQIPALRLVSFIMKRLQNFPHGIYQGDPDTQRLKLDAVPFILIPEQAFLTYGVAVHAPIDLDAVLA